MTNDELSELSAHAHNTMARATKRLYLTETRAKAGFICPSCQRQFSRGVLHFRHDPYPANRMFRGEQTSHWCRDCILSSPGAVKDSTTGRTGMPFVTVATESRAVERSLPLLELLRVELIRVESVFIQQLALEPQLLFDLSPDQFEHLICDRLYAMGFEPRKTGLTNQRDGGIDIVFWPRSRHAFPFLGAAQVKHHREPQQIDGPASIRDFAGAIATLPLNAALLVTNTTFSPDAQWFARARAKLLRLRQFDDIRRWLAGNFSDDAEWREIPESIEVCPGVVIRSDSRVGGRTAKGLCGSLVQMTQRS